MMRGDHGGSNEAWTRDGMNIDLYDPQGIQKPDMAAGQSFEAGWTAQGAVCVHHIRVKKTSRWPSSRSATRISRAEPARSAPKPSPAAWARWC